MISMEYILIIAFELVGISLDFLTKLKAMDNKYPDFSKGEIFSVVWDEDWTTMIGSAIILFFNIIVHFVVAKYTPHLFDLKWLGVPYMVWSFGIALILGWGGQRLIYNWLGSAEKVLDKKISDKLQ